MTEPRPADLVSAGRVRRFRHRVLGWGAAHRRDLPWRRTRDPWHILVSEVMLQQTQVDRVVPHYEGFVTAFPTATACATARASTRTPFVSTAATS